MNRFLSHFYILGYIAMVAPPRAIDLTATERSYEGELSKLPLFLVMVVELVIRIAIVLAIAVLAEVILTKALYEAFHLDLALSIVVSIGVLHSFFHYLFLGYLRYYIGINNAMRWYRLSRNLCYAGLPGLAVTSPLIIHKWLYDQPPFADGRVFEIYLFTTMLMLVAGLIEAVMVKRKPLGIGDHLDHEPVTEQVTAMTDNSRSLQGD